MKKNANIIYRVLMGGRMRLRTHDKLEKPEIKRIPVEQKKERK